MDMIRATADKLEAILGPEIAANYPEVPLDLFKSGLKLMSSSIDVWDMVMKKYVLPHEDLIRQPTPKVDLIELPQFLPGIKLKPVRPEIYNEVNKILRFYLNLHEHLYNVDGRRS
jgi:hypothetical protein